MSTLDFSGNPCFPFKKVLGESFKKLSMAIEVQCEGCQSTIRVKAELAGRTGSCKKCGSSITIPKLPGGQSFAELQTRRLEDATPEEMVLELKRRRKLAVLTLLEGSGGAGPQAAESPSGAVTLGEENVDPQRLVDLYGKLREAAERRTVASTAAELEDDEEVFDLKGNKLGMSLADFKAKHARRVPGLDQPLPWCSDEAPGTRIPDLFAEPWHVEAGIVHARTEHPSENAAPTIAGVEMQLLLYQFIDGQLFQITGFFPNEGYHLVAEALSSKFGKPLKESVQPRKKHWWSMASSIDLSYGAIDPPQPGMVSFYHDRLRKMAGERTPGRSDDL